MVWHLNSERIERAVERLRSLVPCSAPPVPIEEVAQAHGVRLRFVPYDGDLMGLLLKEDGFYIIGINTRYDRIWQRFAIAHELAHIELHHYNGIHIDRGFPAPLKTSQDIHSHEVEASVLASELLMPAAFLEADLRGHHIDYLDDALLRGLAERYQVSIQTLLLRLTREQESTLTSHSM